MTKKDSSIKKSMETLWHEKLAEFKSREKPEVVLLLGDNADLAQITVAWMDMPTSRTKKPPRQPREDDGNRWWNWLWENTTYSRRELMDKAHLPCQGFDQKLKALIGNRILYPDGTIHSFAQRYLREQVVKLFEKNPPRSRGKSKAKP